MMYPSIYSYLPTYIIWGASLYMCESVRVVHYHHHQLQERCCFYSHTYLSTNDIGNMSDECVAQKALASKIPSPNKQQQQH